VQPNALSTASRSLADNADSIRRTSLRKRHHRQGANKIGPSVSSCQRIPQSERRQRLRTVFSDTEIFGLASCREGDLSRLGTIGVHFLSMRRSIAKRHTLAFGFRPKLEPPVTRINILSPLAILVALLGTTTAAAETEKLPLPDKLMQAKTVYIENPNSVAAVRDRENDELKKELKKWGRFRVVGEPTVADLLFLFESSESPGNPVYASGAARPTSIRVVSLSIVDRSTNNILWFDRKSRNSADGIIANAVRGSATRSLVKNLRKRMEEQRKH
jgi:hypothetical protein